MKRNDANKTIALAGIFQAAQLVKHFALTGELDNCAYLTSLDSIFKIDAPNVSSVFGGMRGLRLGLNALICYGRKKPPFKDAVLLRTILHMMDLGKRVLKDVAVLKHLQRRLVPAISQATHFSASDPIVINHLSTIYCQVFLERNLHVPIVGRLDLLKRTEVLEKIRTILLAGIRASVLWYQVGGSRFQFFFSRNKIYGMANELLTHECQSVLS